MIKNKKLSRHEKSKLRDAKLKIIDRFLTPYFCFIKYDEVNDKTSKILADRYNKVWYTDCLEKKEHFITKGKDEIIHIKDNYSSFATDKRLTYYFSHMGILTKLNNFEKDSILPQIRNAYIDKCYDIYINNINNDDVADKMLLCADCFYQEYVRTLDELHGATVINFDEYKNICLKENGKLLKFTRVK